MFHFTDHQSNLIQMMLLNILLWILTHKIILQRTEAIEESKELEIVGRRVSHAVFRFVAIGTLGIVRFVVRPIELSNRFAIREKKELSFAAQVRSACPKTFCAFKFKVFKRNKNVKRGYARSRKRSHLYC